MHHPAIYTPLTDLFGCDYPILCAGMGGVARHALAAAVSNAGGFGCLGMVRESAGFLRSEILAYRSLSDKPFAVNVIPAATDPELLTQQIDICIELQVPTVVLFWDVKPELVKHLQAHGIQVIYQIGTRADALQAIAAGVDALIAQGVEAGGHVRGTTATMALVADIVSLTSIPVIACGGIAAGSELAAALALGAQGICCGTLFLATEESNAHDFHKQRIIESNAEDTFYSLQFPHNWHINAPVRVLKNSVTEGDFSVGPNDPKVAIAEQDGQPVYLFSTDSPLKGATGNLAAMANYAGQGCGQIHAIEPAAVKIQRLLSQADQRLKQLSPAQDCADDEFENRSVENDSAPCFAAREDQSIDPRYMSWLSKDDLMPLLQELWLDKRASAIAVAKTLAQISDETVRMKLSALHRNEAQIARLLRNCIESINSPSHVAEVSFAEQNACASRLMNIVNVKHRLENINQQRTNVFERIRKLIPQCQQKSVVDRLQQILFFAS